MRNQEHLVKKMRRRHFNNESDVLLGPVFVEFPIDVLYPFHLVEREVGIKPNPKTLADKLANL